MVTRAKPPTAPSVAPISSPVAPILLQPPPDWELTDELFIELCELNPGLRFEIDERGRLSIVPGAGFSSSRRAIAIAAQIYAWIMAGGGGEAGGADGAFRIGGVSIRIPDVSWLSPERLALMEPDDEGIPRFCPDFVIELRSPSDRLPDQQRKMRFWMAQGVRLGWLIDPFADTAHIYRPDREPELLQRPNSLSGEDVLPGLVVDLSRVWRDQPDA